MSDIWNSLEAIAVAAEYLEACTCADMVADLRAWIPAATLKAASSQLSPEQRERIKGWVLELNPSI
jgi:hypothetical protein